MIYLIGTYGESYQCVTEVREVAAGTKAEALEIYLQHAGHGIQAGARAGRIDIVQVGKPEDGTVLTNEGPVYEVPQEKA